jgi:hypothetical protein
MPLRVTDLSLRAIPALKPISLVQFLNLSNLHPETPDLFPKNFEVIHTIRIAHLGSLSVYLPIRPRNVVSESDALEGAISVSGSFYQHLLPPIDSRKSLKIQCVSWFESRSWRGK